VRHSLCPGHSDRHGTTSEAVPGPGTKPGRQTPSINTCARSVHLAETQPAGYLDGKDSLGFQRTAIAANDLFWPLLLTQRDTGVNTTSAGGIAGPAWRRAGLLRRNNDGVQQGNETGIGGRRHHPTGHHRPGKSVRLLNAVHEIGRPIGRSET